MSFEDLQAAASQAGPAAPAGSPWDEAPAPAEPVWGEPAEEAKPAAESFNEPPAFEAAPPFSEPAPEPEHAASAAEAAPAAAAAGSLELNDEQVDRIARRVIQLMSDQVVRSIAWEVIPDLAEMVVKERIRQLEAEA